MARSRGLGDVYKRQQKRKVNLKRWRIKWKIRKMEWKAEMSVQNVERNAREEKRKA
jgi:hypothetical protein